VIIHCYALARLGRALKEVPLAPHLSRPLVYSFLLHCQEEIVFVLIELHTTKRACTILFVPFSNASTTELVRTLRNHHFFERHTIVEANGARVLVLFLSLHDPTRKT